MAQGSSITARRIPRPGKASFSSKASSVPRTTVSVMDATQNIAVLPAALQNWSLASTVA
jgi:hypothetical protein